MPQNYAKIKEKFEKEYPESGSIPKSTINRLIDKFEKTGSVHEVPIK